MARKRYLSIASLAVLALAGGTLTACASDTPEDSGADGGADGGTAETQTVRLGVVGAGDPYWAVYEEAVEAELDIDLEIVNFDEYPLPNPALADGDLDINQFQHIIFLAGHNIASGDEITPIGSTAIYPLSLHSTQYSSVDEIQEGDTIAIPNDPSNRARALLVLQQAGLIELEGGGNSGSTPDDIIEASSKVHITELDAAFTASSLNDVAGAIINNDWVQKAGLNFEDALATDDPNDPTAFPYVNVFAVRAEDKDNDLYHRLVEIYHSTPAVLEGLQEVSGGSAVIADISPEELQEALANEIQVIEAQ